MSLLTTLVFTGLSGNLVVFAPHFTWLSNYFILGLQVYVIRLLLIYDVSFIFLIKFDIEIYHGKYIL